MEKRRPGDKETGEEPVIRFDQLPVGGGLSRFPLSPGLLVSLSACLPFSLSPFFLVRYWFSSCTSLDSEGFGGVFSVNLTSDVSRTLCIPAMMTLSSNFTPSLMTRHP